MKSDTTKKRYGEWALVAGAAEGLGASYSRCLARKGLNLIMVDHQAQLLDKASALIEREYKTQVIPIVFDLADESATAVLMKVVEKTQCRLLVYNAAYSRVTPFLSASPADLRQSIDVNCRTQLYLVHAFAKYLQRAQLSGGILLMSSLAGLIGMQLVATYAATKAFAWNLAEALHHELKDYNIDVMACVAGATATPAYLATLPNAKATKLSVARPDRVAERALAQLGKRARYIPGVSNRMNYFLLTRILPRKWAASIANKYMKKVYPHIG